MAPAQETEPRHALRALCLLAVLILAKALSLYLLRDGFSWSRWALLAYFWQDVLIALMFLAIDRVVGRPRVAWTVYAALVCYAALNVPITAVLATPLTQALIRASGGALSDSIQHYATVPNIAGVLAPLAAAALLPVMLAGPVAASSSRARWVLVAVGVALVALGPESTARTDTRGLHRNVLIALVPAKLPAATAAADGTDWRKSPFPSALLDDLSTLAGTARGRNVVLIALESTAARYLRFHGAAVDPTPVLTSIAANALVFERAYAVYPESIKGLFATLCSRYPAFGTPPEVSAQAQCDALPARLASAGYQGALFHSGRFDYLGMRPTIEGRGYHLLEDAGAIGGTVRSSFGVDEPSTIRRMLAWIDTRPPDTPFFLTYLPIAGHHPYATTRRGPFPGSRDFDNYLNALHEGDEAIGALMDGLRARGLVEKTLFVFFGDHGEAFGQHPGNYAHTLFIYEENVHVPLVIAAPGVLDEQPQRVRRTASVIDIAPTILTLLGMRVPASYSGSSLLEPTRRMSLFYTDYSLGWLGLADGCWKYMFEIDSERSRLFDVCADPNEQNDLSVGAPDRITVYRAAVLKIGGSRD